VRLLPRRSTGRRYVIRTFTPLDEARRVAYASPWRVATGCRCPSCGAELRVQFAGASETDVDCGACGVRAGRTVVEVAEKGEAT